MCIRDRRFGIREVWQVEGDTLGTGLFFEEETPPMGDDEPAQLDQALDTLSSGWLLRRYPWAGSLSTAHTVLYYCLLYTSDAADERSSVDLGGRRIIKK